MTTAFASQVCFASVSQSSSRKEERRFRCPREIGLTARRRGCLGLSAQGYK
jgi:hypothetical protein